MLMTEYCFDIEIIDERKQVGRPVWSVDGVNGLQHFFSEQEALNCVMSTDAPPQIKKWFASASRINLVRISDSAKVTFYVTHAGIEGLTSHMNSLTDSLCSSFFDKDKRKKGGK
jgi:hypothetical protein